MPSLLEQLHQSRAGAPRTEWVTRNREILLSQIRAQGSQLDLAPASLGWLARVEQSFATVPFRVATMVAAVVVVALGMSVTTVWANQSLPGDLLYPVKLTTERVQVSLTTNDEARAKLAAEFAGKRVDELQALTRLSGDQPATVAAAVQTTLANYQKNLTEVHSTLTTLRASHSDSAAQTAALVNDRLAASSAKLEEVKRSVSPAGASDVAAALAASDAASDTALAILLERIQNDPTGAVNRELRDAVVKSIAALEQKATTLNSQLTAVTAATKEQVSAQEKVELQATVGEQLAAVSTKPAVVQNAVTAAKLYLERGDLATSLQKLTEAKQVTREVESVVTTADQALDQPVIGVLDVEQVSGDGSTDDQPATDSSASETDDRHDR